MGAFDGWASAALGGGIGGTATGIALYFTIRHDRAARRDDRLHASADRALVAAVNLQTTLFEHGADDLSWITELARFRTASTTFLARMPRNDPARRLLYLITESVADQALDFRKGNTTKAQALHEVRRYLEYATMWVFAPGDFLPGAAVVAEYEAKSGGRTHVTPRPDHEATTDADQTTPPT